MIITGFSFNAQSEVGKIYLNATEGDAPIKVWVEHVYYIGVGIPCSFWMEETRNVKCCVASVDANICNGSAYHSDCPPPVYQVLL